MGMESSFYCGDSGYHPTTRRTLLFSSRPNLSILEEAEHWVIDGTFKVVPSLFFQLLTIHALLSDGWVIPCVYVLLPCKVTSLYSGAFEALDSLPGLGLNPSTVLMDYELAMRNAVDLIWPSTTLRGCLFHFKQPIIRHAYSTGRKGDYDTIGNPIRSAIQMLGALAWVPEGEVVDAYHIIKPTLSSDLAEFLQYFEETWIGTPTSPARYPPSHWNQHEAILSFSYADRLT